MGFINIFVDTKYETKSLKEKFLPILSAQLVTIFLAFVVHITDVLFDWKNSDPYYSWIIYDVALYFNLFLAILYAIPIMPHKCGQLTGDFFEKITGRNGEKFSLKFSIFCAVVVLIINYLNQIEVVTFYRNERSMVIGFEWLTWAIYGSVGMSLVLCVIGLYEFDAKSNEKINNQTKETDEIDTYYK
ncbi:MAG: hypothetical protein R3B84_09020 [Zavarzinella sp.]